MKTSVETRVLETVEDLRLWRASQRVSEEAGGKAVLGFVPTMGALHEGHLSLIRMAATECSRVVVSIFVNPLQFGPNEDFDKYPRSFEADVERCRQSGAHVVFHPTPAEFYAGGVDETTRVVPPHALVNRLCGKFRTGHFEGVATVVMKLFALVEPDRAYFGEKDYQQLVIIKRMVADLNVPVTVVPVPTVREKDGLALSSRNAYLTDEQRSLAPRLHEALLCVRDQALSGKMSLEQALDQGRALIAATPDVCLQYLEVCDPDTLQPLSAPEVPMVVLAAAKLGNVRLIDNLIVRKA